MNDEEFFIGLTHSFVLAAEPEKKREKDCRREDKASNSDVAYEPRYDLRCGLCWCLLLMINKPKLSPSRIWCKLT